MAELFKVHHERRPPNLVTPFVPDWKRPLLDLNGEAPSDSEEEMDDDGKKEPWQPVGADLFSFSLWAGRG